MRRVVAVLVAVTAVVGLCGADATRSRRMSAASEAYLLEALALLEEHAVDRATVDWREVRRAAFQNAVGARTPGETHYAVMVAIDAVGNPHTSLVLPGPGGSPPTRAGDMPRGRLTAGGRVAVVSIPGLSLADERTVRRYLDTGIDTMRAMDAARPCGWIVDLRNDTGGNMWPMVTVLSPLLEDGLLGSFVGPDGRTDWELRDGQVRFDGTVLHENPVRLTAPEPPVAVLTSGHTASAGEATLIAFLGLDRVRTFGEPTAGYATANAAFELDDGALLSITTAYDVDRTGRRYGNTPIPPDHATAEPEAAAAAWLVGHCD